MYIFRLKDAEVLNEITIITMVPSDLIIDYYYMGTHIHKFAMGRPKKATYLIRALTY
jgi:hypothetical protein